MSYAKFYPLDCCALCESRAPLCRSHIIPDFLFKLLREPAGRFYSADRPKRAVQAGTVVHLLCAACEGKFSRWEHAFQKTFFPRKRRPELPIVYGEWMLPFAVSVSWRVLAYLKFSKVERFEQSNEIVNSLLPSLPEDSHENADQALDRWGQYLRGEEADLGRFEQHLVFLNGKNFTEESSHIVGFTAYVTKGAVGVYCQLGPMCLIGFIRNDEEASWLHTRISHEGGEFAIRPQVVPQSFAQWLGTYFLNISRL